MNTFLAHIRAASLASKKITNANEAQTLRQQCNGHTESTLPATKQLKKDEYFCYDAMNTVFSFGPSLKFEAEDPKDSSKIISKNNAYGATHLFVKITNTGSDTVTVHNWEQNMIPYTNEGSNSVLVLKKEWKGTITNKAEKDESLSELLSIYNPNGKTKVTVDPSDAAGLVVSFEDQKPIEKKEEIPNIEYVMVYASPKKGSDEETGEWTADVKIEASSVPDNYPEKITLVQNGAIYSKDDEDYDFMNGGGLPAGAIAGIVIACVVVVGVIVFCVVWFVVLKKDCCCGKGGKDEPAA